MSSNDENVGRDDFYDEDYGGGHDYSFTEPMDTGNQSSNFSYALNDSAFQAAKSDHGVGNPLVPVTVFDLAQLRGADSEAKFCIGDYAFEHLKLVCTVRVAESREGYNLYTVCEVGSVSDEPTFILIDNTNGNMVEVGATVFVVGKLQLFNGSPAMLSFKLRKMGSEKEVELYKMECRLAKIFYQKRISERSAEELDQMGYASTIFSPHPPTPRQPTKSHQAQQIGSANKGPHRN